MKTSHFKYIKEDATASYKIQLEIAYQLKRIADTFEAWFKKKGE